MCHISSTRLLWLASLALSTIPLLGCKKPEVAAQEEKLSPRLKESPVNPAGYQLLLDYEVGGGKRYYDRFLAHPTWPGWMSGVTVAVGYDLGYNSRTAIGDDWRHLPKEDRERLVEVQGLRGEKARARLGEVSDIRIDWEAAESVFQSVSIVRFRDLAERTYPGYSALHRNAQAALLSLTFNRGSSMTGERRTEMREIRACVSRQDYAGMARWNRASVRLWKGTPIESGMLRRREAEARLMETPE